MTASGPLPYFVLTDPIDEFIVSTLLSPREAASLKQEQLEVLRAHVRSEIIHSDSIRQVLSKRAKEVFSELTGEDTPSYDL